MVRSMEEPNFYGVARGLVCQSGQDEISLQPADGHSVSLGHIRNPQYSHCGHSYYTARMLTEITGKRKMDAINEAQRWILSIKSTSKRIQHTLGHGYEAKDVRVEKAAQAHELQECKREHRDLDRPKSIEFQQHWGFKAKVGVLVVYHRIMGDEE
jgi:hypothetical protein